MSEHRTTSDPAGPVPGAARGPIPATGDPGIEAFGYHQELKRSLSFTDLLVYAIGGLAMAFTAASYSQMSRAFPMAGSVYTYAGRGIAQPVGFIAGWMILLDYVLVPGLLYLIASIAMNSILSDIPVWLWLVAFVALNTVVNYFGIEFTARVNKIMLVGELIVLAIFLVIGVIALANGEGRGFDFSPVYNSDTFSLSLVFGAVSIAVLSFLGFDGISTLAEENRESARSIGKSMIAALALAGVLFIVQTWIAALLVPNPDTLIAEGDAAGTAFYDAAEVAGGHWLSVLTAVATAIAWGFANSLVAQAATSRLLFAMARDKQLPGFLAKVHHTRRVPVNATLVVALISLALGLYMTTRDDYGIGTLSTLVNFGALTAFLLLHVSVVVHFVVRRKSRDWWRHLVVPVIGFVILLYVLINAKLAAQALGLGWLVLGLVIMGVLLATGREPELKAEEGL